MKSFYFQGILGALSAVLIGVTAIVYHEQMTYGQLALVMLFVVSVLAVSLYRGVYLARFVQRREHHAKQANEVGQHAEHQEAHAEDAFWAQRSVQFVIAAIVIGTLIATAAGIAFNMTLE